MKVFIPAAGTGSRLRPLTANRPKTMLHIMGYPIIYHLITGLIDNGVNDILIVSGYKHEVLADYLNDTFPDVNLNIVYNDRYLTMNNIYSLHLAEECLRGHDVLIVNSDVFCDPELLKKALRAPLDTMVVDVDAPYTREATKINIDAEGFIDKISKELESEQNDGEYIGIMKLSKHSAEALLAQASAFIKRGNTQVWFVYALNKILDQIKLKPIFTEGLIWEEIDFIADYRQALALASLIGGE